MFETDPLTMAQFATDTAQIALQAGPPADLPGAVPDFVGNILGEIGSMAGAESGGLGETISGLTPDGDAAADAASENATADVATGASGDTAGDVAAEATGDTASNVAAENAPVDVTGR